MSDEKTWPLSWLPEKSAWMDDAQHEALRVVDRDDALKTVLWRGLALERCLLGDDPQKFWNHSSPGSLKLGDDNPFGVSVRCDGGSAFVELENGGYYPAASFGGTGACEEEALDAAAQNARRALLDIVRALERPVERVQTEEELAAQLQLPQRFLHLQQLYRHQKSGHLYQVRDMALLESTLEPLVVYSLADRPDLMFARPFDEFVERFEACSVLERQQGGTDE